MLYENEWYKPICMQCPYFSNMTLPKDSEPIIKCERPNNVTCPGDSPIIQMTESKNYLRKLILLNQMADAAKQKTNFTKPKAYKRGKVKRR